MSEERETKMLENFDFVSLLSYATDFINITIVWQLRCLYQTVRGNEL